VSENKRKTVALTTLGCKVNQFETASFISRFQDHGIEVLPFSQKADIYVVNTCAVTGKAGAQSRQVIRQALRTNPQARIIVTGCYAQVATQEVLELASQPICIVGNDNKHLLVDIALSNRLCDLEIYMGDVRRKKEICDLPVHNYSGRTRAFLKIQDGCDNFCTYCIVPYARGRVRSLEPERVLAQIAVFASEGFRELVLTGIHVGMYGKDLEEDCTLAELVRRILAEKHAMRYRISSLEPGELSDELLQLIAGHEAMMPHFHLPLQSGDPTILKRMNRNYSVEEFAGVVNKIIEAIPEAGIGLDVLVGFPGEDESMFRNTLELIERLPVAYLHVFPYSKRPGTVAEKMPGQVPKPVKDERVARLQELNHKKKTAFYNKHIGTTHQVLAEGKKNQFKLLRGFTENYIPVFFQGPPALENKIVDVKIERTMDENVFGKRQGTLFD
jgi:threonylcarbamoyladenosine tRNA methylthiotransferase MtaB